MRRCVSMTRVSAEAILRFSSSMVGCIQCSDTPDIFVSRSGAISIASAHRASAIASRSSSAVGSMRRLLPALAAMTSCVPGGGSSGNTTAKKTPGAYPSSCSRKRSREPVNFSVIDPVGLSKDFLMSMVLR